MLRAKFSVSQNSIQGLCTHCLLHSQNQCLDKMIGYSCMLLSIFAQNCPSLHTRLFWGSFVYRGIYLNQIFSCNTFQFLKSYPSLQSHKESASLSQSPPNSPSSYRGRKHIIPQLNQIKIPPSSLETTGTATWVFCRYVPRNRQFLILAHIYT